MRTTYLITVGETGNECGHSRAARVKDDAAAIRAAKRDVKCYDGDGWWRVECEGRSVASGGRENY